MASEEVIWEDDGASPQGSRRHSRMPSMDWDSLPGSRRESALPSLDCWDYTIELECLKGPQDLHLAAELGKTLLERNKELENEARLKQAVLDEQRKKIEHLTKQTEALRSTNDSRIRISEQLEISINDMENANARLSMECLTLTGNVKRLKEEKEQIEARCEELQNALDEAKELHRIQKQQLRIASPKKILKNDPDNQKEDSRADLSGQLEDLKRQKSRDQRRISDQEAELARRTQDILALEDEIIFLRQKAEKVQMLQEEIDALQESSHLCSMCSKKSYGNMPNYMHLSLDHEDIVIDSRPESISSDAEERNPYREFIEKFGPIMEENYVPRRMSKTVSTNNCLSLQDELKLSGDFCNFLKEEPETKRGKATPTDFSEAETSSSGFSGCSDETSHKFTQTDLPASFLCSIEDGTDCRFLIYDDACPIDNRFRRTPGYRSLFREIFEVLKRAASAKEDTEILPKLEDQDPPKAPHATPCQEEPPIDFDDLQSIPDSIAASDCSSIPDYQDLITKPDDSEKTDPKRTKDLLEYVASVKRKPKKRSASRKKEKLFGLPDSVTSTPSGSPRRVRRQARRNTDSPAAQPARVLTTLQRPQQGDEKVTGEWEYQPFVSTAAQDVAKLKRLEKSYAEVLRYTPGHPSYRSFGPPSGKK